MKKKSQEKYIRVCPNCGSANVTLDSSDSTVWAFGSFSRVNYICKKCKFKSVIFPEVEFGEIAEFRKKIKETGKK